ncbi:MAG: hypothetical protein QOG00_3197 [Pyrinomonadaceae bacterium]|nr:hypothetical protein [Pyrinomonadaceae bacterium]
MELYKTTHNGKVALINGNHILTVNFDEDEKQLVIKFDNGETISFSGDEAVAAWDTFTSEIINEEFEDDDKEKPATDLNQDEEDEERDPFEDIKRELATIGLQVERRSITSTWDARSLREHAEELGSDWDSKQRKKLKSELNQIREQAYALADEAETIALDNTIDECLTTPIVNTSTVKSILRTLNKAEEDLKRSNKMTDDLSHKIRNAKERLAWFRTKKKLDDAAVTLAGGNQRKSEKYRREAALLIKQDWAEVFPGEPAPEISIDDKSETGQAQLLI